MLAIWLALHSPELEVRGVSVSYGNTTVEHAYRNAIELLRRAGRRLTLAFGARRPMKRQLAVAQSHDDVAGAGRHLTGARDQFGPGAPGVVQALGDVEQYGGVGGGSLSGHPLVPGPVFVTNHPVA